MKVSKMPVNPYSGVNQYSYADPAATVGPAPTMDQFKLPGGSMYGGMYGAVGSMYDTAAYNRALSQYQKDLNAANASVGRHSDGSPMAPEFQSLIDPNTGMLKGGLSFDQSSIDGMDQFKDFATGTGPSQYAQANMNRLGLQTSFMRDRASREANQAGANMRRDLMMRGGMSGGARERIASQVAGGAMQGRQQARQTELLGLSDILTQDAGAKQTALGRYVDLGARGQEFNIQNALSEIGQERDAAWKNYEQEGERWAADKKAQAQRNASGCFIAGTPITMADGTRKPIEAIKIGDETLKGGKVYAVYQQAWNEPVYNYGGIYVTGQHPVFDNGTWKRVKDSDNAFLTNVIPMAVYDFSNDKHRIVIGGVLFGDFAENDDFYLTDEESIAKLNDKTG